MSFHARCFSLARPAAVALAGLVAVGAAQAKVYTCVTADGRRLTADRPIAQCADREQRELSSTGSVVRVVPPNYTAEERAAREAAEQKAAADQKVQAELIRMDRNLLRRYPTEASHQKARESALGDVRSALNASQTRLKVLADERKPLDLDAEFYKGKPLPIALKRKIDANDAARQAVLESQVNNESELQRVSANYDRELDRLRKLWGGAAPGSLGPLQLAAKPVPVPVKAEPKPEAKPPLKPAAAKPAASGPAAATVKR